MKRLVIPILMIVATPALAQVQEGATVAPPAASPAATPATFDGDTPIETIAADPAGKAVLEKDLPHLLTHPAYEQFKAMSLHQLEPLSGGALTDENIAKVEADLKAAGH